MPNITCQACGRGGYEMNDKIHCSSCHKPEEECRCPNLDEMNKEKFICLMAEFLVKKTKEAPCIAKGYNYDCPISESEEECSKHLMENCWEEYIRYSNDDDVTTYFFFNEMADEHQVEFLMWLTEKAGE